MLQPPTLIGTACRTSELIETPLLSHVFILVSSSLHVQGSFKTKMTLGEEICPSRLDDYNDHVVKIMVL